MAGTCVCSCLVVCEDGWCTGGASALFLYCGGVAVGVPALAEVGRQSEKSLYVCFGACLDLR